MSFQISALRSSRAEVWDLKPINFGAGDNRRQIKIIMQNFNGPCSFIAICNILILRGSIKVLPPERTTVSYEFLSQLVAGYLLESSPDVDISAALSIMPLTQKGMNLNPVFTSPTSFHPGGAGGELKLFEQAGIKLVHGWLVDTDSPEAIVLAKVPDYDSALNLIVDADHTAHGQLLVHEDVEAPNDVALGSPTIKDLTDEERAKIEDAMIVRTFLHNTQSQMTYHGLFNLATLLEPGSLVALFRNSHLSVLFKPEGEESSLYTLVTDQVFFRESSIVWERLEDIDGGWSTFVDSEFIRSSPAGGDVAGQTAEGTLRALEAQESDQNGTVDPADQALAQQLQAEEDAYARRLYLQQKQDRQQRHEQSLENQQTKLRKKASCIIM